MRLAYLCNVYPAVSHSFIRREIQGIEASGNEVSRFSIRPSQDGLKDDADLTEASNTMSVLEQGMLALSFAALALLFSRPVRTFAALRMAFRLSSPGFERKARHVAYWLEAAWLVRRMEKLGVEHLHVHFGTNPAAVGAIARAWGGPPFSFTVHGPDEFDAPLALGLPLKVQTSAFVVAITSYCRSQLMRWSAPRHWNKIELIRCGLDDDILNSDPQPVAASSREFVCVARLSAQKGLPLLIAAAAAMRDSGERFTLTIVGGGELREELERDIRDHDLEGIVSLAGVCSTEDMHRRILGARAFVLPSFAEGLPMTIMEAFALSRPVITTAIAGIPELVDEECGWVVTAGSVEALVDAMTSALHAPVDELSRKGSVGRERVLRLHSAKSTAEGILKAIKARSA